MKNRTTSFSSSSLMFYSVFSLTLFTIYSSYFDTKVTNSFSRMLAYSGSPIRFLEGSRCTVYPVNWSYVCAHAYFYNHVLSPVANADFAMHTTRRGDRHSRFHESKGGYSAYRRRKSNRCLQNISFFRPMAATCCGCHDIDGWCSYEHG